MISRLFSGLVALIPLFALAQSGESPTAQAADLQSRSLDELCRAREREEALDELERREIFNSRELRAIRDGEVRTGMSLRALICARGQPASIVPEVGIAFPDARTAPRSSGPVPVAAYIYLPDGADSGTVAYVVESAAESKVVHEVESRDPEATASNPSFRLQCSTTLCQFIDTRDDFNVDSGRASGGTLPIGGRD
jgi:hypothetical protein